MMSCHEERNRQMSLKTAYALLWIIWLGSFLAIEFSALLSGHPQFTLSDFVWRAERLGRAWTVLRYFIAVFCVWLAGHMIFGWWR